MPDLDLIKQEKQGAGTDAGDFPKSGRQPRWPAARHPRLAPRYHVAAWYNYIMDKTN
jgi:hypothetical protein